MKAADVARAADKERQRATGSRLRAARIRAGLSLARTVAPMRAAGFTNWHINTLVTAEAGTRRIRELELAALADILGIELASLLPDAEKAVVGDA